MADLADLEDYQDRYGVPADSAVVETLLADASSLVRRHARQQIDLVTGDVVTLDGDGTALLLLYELPVVAVTEVKVDGVVLDPAEYRWRRWGTLRRRHARWGSDSEVQVTCSHGLDPVPEWIVSTVCAAAKRAMDAWTPDGAGTNVWLRDDEKSRLGSLRGPL